MNPKHQRVVVNEPRRNFLGTVGTGLGLAAVAAMAQSSPGASPVAGLFNVRDFGAKGDGVTKDTAAIQSTIDACSAAGGGLVYFPQGRFLSGTLTLKDNVTLHLSPNAILLGSPDAKDYTAKPFPARDLDVGGFEVWALVYADGTSNIGIEGLGTIDGNGKPFPPVKHAPDIAGSVRPRAVFLKNCRQVRLRDITIRESAMWSAHLALCEKVFVHGISIYSSFFVGCRTN
jgi:polygalacturonase